MKYRVLQGKYRDRTDGKVKTKGAIVESYSALDKSFPNYFEVLEEEEIVQEEVLEEEDVSVEETNEVLEENEEVAEYELQSKGIGWYNVIHVGTGECVNDKAMRKADAEELLESMNHVENS